MQMIKIKVIWCIPSFVCPKRFINCGPFELDEIITVPRDVAELFVKKKRARYIEEPFKNYEDRK